MSRTMQKRSVAWLKEQNLNKRFLVLADEHRARVTDPEFENWVDNHARQSGLTWWGDGFQTTDHGFSFCSMPAEVRRSAEDPFLHIQPVYTRYSCPWEYVTAIYEAPGGFVYIFTSKDKRQKD